MSQFIALVFIATLAFVLGHRRGTSRQQGTASPDLLSTSPQLPPHQSLSRIAPGSDALFLTGWLLTWSMAIIMALGILASDRAGGANTFLVGWLLAACIGWGLAVRRIYRLIVGPSHARN